MLFCVFVFSQRSNGLSLALVDADSCERGRLPVSFGDPERQKWRA